MHTIQSIDLVLREIQAQVPQRLRSKLFRIVKKTPTAEFVVKKALKQKDLDPKKREEYELLLKTGEFSKTEEVINESIAKQIDKIVEYKIKEAVKKGRLPDKEELERLNLWPKRTQDLPKNSI